MKKRDIFFAEIFGCSYDRHAPTRQRQPISAPHLMPSCITCLARDYYLVSHLYYYSSKIHKKVRITLEQLGFRSQNDNCRGFFDPGTTYVLFPSSETQQIFRDTISTLNSVGEVSRSPVAATCGQRVLSVTSNFLVLQVC